MENFFGRSTTGPKHLAPDTGSGGAMPPNGTVLGSEGGEAESKPSVPKKPAKPKKARRSFWQFVKDVFNGLSKTVAVILIIAIVILALVGLALWNPLHWTLPFSSPANSYVGAVMDPIPSPASAQTLADLKVLARQFSIKGTADLDRLYQQKLIDASQYLLFSQLFENDKTLAAELTRVASDQDSNNLVFGKAIREMDARVTATDKKVVAVAQAAVTTSGSQGPTLSSTDFGGSQGTGSTSVSAKTSGVSWKTWKNATGLVLYARLMGVYWPAGAKPQDHLVRINPGEGFVSDKFNANFHSGDYFVLYDLHNDGKDYTWEQVEANPSLGRYHNVDGSIVRFGYGRAMIVVDNSGNLRSGLAIKQGEAMNVNLGSYPPNGRITLAVKAFDGEVIPTRNIEK